MKNKILDILKGSPKPLQSKEIATLLQQIHNVNIKQYMVRDILWGELKEDVIYRGKPHWDYKVKTNFKINLKFHVRSINYIEISGQPLYSIQISFLKSEIIYIINKANKHYSESNEPLIIYFLEAWEKLLISNNYSEGVFHEYITHLI